RSNFPQIKHSENKLRDIEKEMVEAIELFKRLAGTAGQSDVEQASNIVNNGESQSGQEAGSQQTVPKTQDAERAEGEPSDNGAFLFGGADAFPIRRILDDKEVEEYKHEYNKWVEGQTEQEEVHHREKRRANEDVDPLHYLTLDYAAAHPNAPALDLSDIKNALTDYVAAVQGQADPDEIEYRFNLLEYEIAKVRHQNKAADTFLCDAADLYSIRMLDTDPNVRLGYAYYQQRAREAASQGFTYYDTGLEEFYGFKTTTYHDDPASGMAHRATALTAKTLAAVEMKETLDGFRYGMAMAEIAIYSQMLMHKESKKIASAIIARQDQNQYYPQAKRTVLKLNKELAAVPNSDGSPPKKYRFKAMLFAQAQIAVDGAPLAPTNLGLCDLLATSIAYELKTAKTDSTSTRAADGTNVHTLKQIFERLDDLDDYLSADPVFAYRFMQGATHINDELQIARNVDFAKYRRKLNSLDDLPKYITRIAKDDPIVLSFGRLSQN
ncbi:MAG: hypothetical protein ACRC9T_03310, partial [Vibrionaceae bacterium]